jgi:retinol dehydrogenase-12
VSNERDIAGERIVVTGATNGIGKELARDLVRRGAEVTIVARNHTKAEATADEFAAEAGAAGRPDVVLGDLSDLSSVREAAAELGKRYDRIDVLVNNAGINALKPETTVDGFDQMMATNHFGPFLLTNLLLEQVKAAAPARIVFTASEAHRGGGRPDPATLGDPKQFGMLGAQRAYGASKLMNVLTTAELGRRLEGTGVTANCFCPGLVATDLAGNTGAAHALIHRLSGTPLVRRPEQGARMGIRLVVDPDLAGTTGEFFTSTPGARLLPKAGSRKDLDYQRAIWDRTAQLVGLG